MRNDCSPNGAAQISFSESHFPESADQVGCVLPARPSVAGSAVAPRLLVVSSVTLGIASGRHLVPLASSSVRGLAFCGAPRPEASAAARSGEITP